MYAYVEHKDDCPFKKGDYCDAERYINKRNLLHLVGEIGKKTLTLPKCTCKKDMYDCIIWKEQIELIY